MKASLPIAVCFTPFMPFMVSSCRYSSGDSHA